MQTLYKDRERIALLWLLNDTTLEIPEDQWPPCTHGDDRHAADQWANITGLDVTITTLIKTTIRLEPKK